jgi:hypothetical protein
MVCYINTAYVQVNINTDVREPVIVPVMVVHVMVNILHVLAQQITLGVAVRAFVIELLNMLVQVRGIVREVGPHAAENIRVVTVLHITVGMAVPVLIPTVTHVRVVRLPQARLVVTEHPVRYLRYVIVGQHRERVIHVLLIPIVTHVRAGIVRVVQTDILRRLLKRVVVEQHPEHVINVLLVHRVHRIGVLCMVFAM